MQNDIESKVDAQFDSFLGQKSKRSKAKLSKGSNVFFSGMAGDEATCGEEDLLEALVKHDVKEKGDDAVVEELFFCLPCDLKEEVHSKPPAYRHVHALQYDPSSKPQRIPPTGDTCQCFERCDDSCINRTLYTECFGDASKAKSGGASGFNCLLGPNCGNRQLGQRKPTKCKPKREQGKGWGLVTVNKAKKGDLIHEYVGEVIDSKGKEERLSSWSKEHPNDPNFYLMALQSGWFVDARDVANLSRFINHSCEPNCSLHQINVNGRMRCGIYALRDIEAGEFLSYDYHFDTRDGDKFVCSCGSKICRGTMKSGASPLDASSDFAKSKNKVWEDAKAGYERDQKFLADFHEDRERRKTQVGELVPSADSGSKDELVANGPQMKHRAKAQSNRIFLWRSAVRGSNFAQRFTRMEAKGGL